MINESANQGADGEFELSIVVPALDEEENVGPLVEEVFRHVLGGGIAAELIVIDDGSTDGTLGRLRALQETYDWLVVLHRDEPRGQSAAMGAGIARARGKYIGMLDADLQNDPADLPKMLALLKAKGVDMVQGDRSKDRQDHWVRKMSSWVGRTARRVVLGDRIRDTGCSARVVKAVYAKQFPLSYKGMHRFMPAYAKLLGARVIEMDAHHRQRVAGEAKYGVGNRALVGLIDCFAVRWMSKRLRDTATVEITKES